MSTWKRPSKKWLSLLFMALLVLAGLSSSAPALSRPPGDDPVADVTILPDRVEWQAKVKHAGLTLTVSGPGDTVYRQAINPGQPLVFGVTDEAGQARPDGVYTYELVVTPVLDDATRVSREAGGGNAPVLGQVQSGHFAIQNGAFVTGGAEPVPDVVHNDDVIVTGSLCVGFDCVNGEGFGFDTIRLKENNLRIHFQDTSNSGSFPTNDWRITINDSANGGASYFAIDDVDGGRTPFKIEAGAPSNSLYVDDYGRVGLGTSTPYVEAHIKDGDTPTVRLQQDGSSGWTAQTWDLAGNETNFFIRDVTNGSKLFFRAQPGAPTDALTIRNDGAVGMGTWSPTYPLEIERTGSNPQIYFDRTDGAKGIAGVTSNKTRFGSYSNHPVTIVVNNVKVGEFDTSGNLLVAGSVTPNAWGRTGKEEPVTAAALDAQVATLQAENAALRSRVDDLETRMAALEARSPAAEPAPSSLLPDAGLLLAGLTLPAGVVWMIRQKRNR